MKKNSHSQNLMITAFVLALFPCFSYAGVAPVNSLLETGISILSSIGIAVTTLMLMLAGYKVMFKGDTLGECQRIFIGAGLIGGASVIAKLFF